MVRLGEIWTGKAVEAWCGSARSGKAWRLRLGKARLDMPWRGGHSLIILNVREV